MNKNNSFSAIELFVQRTKIRITKITTLVVTQQTHSITVKPVHGIGQFMQACIQG